MNNPNPFVPKGSLLEQQSQRRSRLKIVVGCVVGLSTLSLVVMLVQGCHREAPENNGQPPEAQNPPMIDTNPPAESNAPNMVAAPPMSPPPSNQPVPVPMPPQVPPTAPPAPPVMNPPVVEAPAVGTEYTIVSGDTLAKIAKKNGVTVKALEAANPGVDPKKLRPGKKLTIPAGGSVAATSPGAPSAVGATDTGTGAGEVYVVKSGDTLTKIAKKNGVTLKALRAANPGRSSDHLKVGDKLNIPAKAEAAASAPAPTPDASQLPPVPPPTAPAQAPSPVAPAPSSPAPAPGH